MQNNKTSKRYQTQVMNLSFECPNSQNYHSQYSQLFKRNHDIPISFLFKRLKLNQHSMKQEHNSNSLNESITINNQLIFEKETKMALSQLVVRKNKKIKRQSIEKGITEVIKKDHSKISLYKLQINLKPSNNNIKIKMKQSLGKQVKIKVNNSKNGISNNIKSNIGNKIDSNINQPYLPYSHGKPQRLVNFVKKHKTLKSYLLNIKDKPIFSGNKSYLQCNK